MLCSVDGCRYLTAEKSVQPSCKTGRQSSLVSKKKEQVIFEFWESDVSTCGLGLPDWRRYCQRLYQELSLLIFFILFFISRSHSRWCCNMIPMSSPTLSPDNPPLPHPSPPLNLRLPWRSLPRWIEEERGSQRKAGCVNEKVSTCCSVEPSVWRWGNISDL